MFGSSQGFGYGDVAAGTQEAPKRARTEEKQTCIPVTVRILQDAIARHTDSSEVLIHGTEASIIHLVGAVEGLVKQSATLEFQINDASGRMKVRYYGSGSGSMEAVDGLSVGRYVSIVGSLRTSPSPHISAMTLQPVASADEISYHMIEVAHAALRLRNPSKSGALTASIAGSSLADPITPNKPSAGFGLGLGGASTISPVKPDAPVASNTAQASVAEVPLQTPPKKDLRTCVVEALQQVRDSGSQEGISVSALIDRLTPAAGASEKVRDVLAQLVDEGEAFTTIDDDHFTLI
jgi:hypothetical protein